MSQRSKDQQEKNSRINQQYIYQHDSQIRLCLILDSNGIVICTLVMALRVLLADESSTIKKALQLALSDFAVEVKSVPSGLDVLTVAQDFSPDIVFADILLSKKNGYEVCAELKANPKFTKTPIILMWSGFMDFNESLAASSKYTDKIEKPFDTETLRDLVNKYVKKTQNHPLRGLLDFPKFPDFVESETHIRQRTTYVKPTKPVDQKPVIEDVEEDFKPVQIKETTLHSKPQQPTQTQNPQSTAAQPTTDEFDIHIETENYGEFEEVILVKTEKNQNQMQNKIQDQLKSYLENSPVALNKIQLAQNAAGDKPQNLTRFEEQLMREEIRLMAEKICWQIIPDITEKLVREELDKLLKDIDKSI